MLPTLSAWASASTTTSGWPGAAAAMIAARVLRRRPLGDRQAAAMEMEAADRVDDLGRGEVEGQIGTGVEAVGGLRAQGGEAGVAHEDRADRVAGKREQPGDDQPALGDEQAAPPHEIGLADGAVVEDARVIGRRDGD